MFLSIIPPLYADTIRKWSLWSSSTFFTFSLHFLRLHYPQAPPLCSTILHHSSPPPPCNLPLMEAKSFEGKRTFVNKDYVVEDDIDDDLDEEEGGEMISFAENERKRAVAPFSGKKGSGAAAGGVSPPFCQAEKCGADLTDAKRYHRRHKVCEFHSKAASVIVAGQRQRFCQQCSRFHELYEFDEAKRSCRRRLAGHNERRRKGSTESGAESSSRKGVVSQPREIQTRQAEDQRSRTQMTIPANSGYKHLQIR